MRMLCVMLRWVRMGLCGVVFEFDRCDVCVVVVV